MERAEFREAPQSGHDGAVLARQALSHQLARLSRFARAATKSPHETPEHVHHLRVATRKLGAVLRVFADYLPEAARRRVARSLSRWRRRAGAARDLDVFMQRVVNERLELSRTTLAPLIYSLSIQRSDAQQKLCRTLRRKPRQKLFRSIERLTQRVAWRGAGTEPALEDLTRSVWKELAEQLEIAFQKAQASPDEWHPLRIATKRVRYAVELLQRPENGADDSGLLRELTELQDVLGRVNDLVAAQTYWDCWLTQYSDTTAQELTAARDAERQEQSALQTKWLQAWPPERCQELVHRLRTTHNI